MSWWSPAAVVAGLGDGFLARGADLPGIIVMSAGPTVLSGELARKLPEAG